MTGRAALVLGVLFCSACAPKPDLPHIVRVPGFALHDQNARATSTRAAARPGVGRQLHLHALPGRVPAADLAHGRRAHAARAAWQAADSCRSRSTPHTNAGRAQAVRAEARRRPARLDVLDRPGRRGEADRRRRLQAEPLRRNGRSRQGRRHLAWQSLRVGRPPTRIRGFYASDQEGLLRLARDARILVAEKRPKS